MDIEELNDFGTLNDFCPYYYSFKLSDNADIMFMPYNYLLE
jgi:hypothetical protein